MKTMGYSADARNKVIEMYKVGNGYKSTQRNTARKWNVHHVPQTQTISLKTKD